MSNKKANVQFISVSTAKAQLGVDSMEVKNNPATKKDFLVLGNGSTMRCQNGIDGSKPMQFIVEEGKELSTDGCLINYDDTKGATTRFTI